MSGLIQKYHVSKNLFDKNTMVVPWYIETQGEVIQSTGGSYSIVVPCKPNTTYTCSFPQVPSQHLVRAMCFANYPSVDIYGENYAGYSGGVDKCTYTTNSTAKYMMYFLWNTAAHPPAMTSSQFFAQTMLNEGSTALPYEPYGNLFVDIPYSKLETATDVVTSLPVTVYGDGETNISLLLKGNTDTSGTASPSSPITVDGVGEETANLFDEETLEGYYTSSGSYNYVTGQLCTKNKIAVNPNTEYWLGIPATNPLAFLAVSTYDSQGAFIERFVLPPYTGAGVQYTTNANTYFINVNFSTYYGGSYKNDVMICEGAQRSYQPYNKYEISISSNGTPLTPMYFSQQLLKVGDYSDNVNSSGTANYKIKKLVLTGNETATSVTQTTDGNNYCIAYKYSDLGMTDILDYDEYTYNCDYPVFVSTHFTMKSIAGATLPNEYNNISAGEMGGNTWKEMYDKPETFNRYLIFCVAGITTLADFRAWLAAQYAAGTPVTLWYILATPTTESVTVPEITTTGGEVSIDVDTTVKPSELDLTYHGWHEHEPLKRENGSWS